MRIVIDIPHTKEQWENAKEYGHIDIDGVEIAQKILDGIPLPEGHGRLIDADELKTMCYEVLVDTDNPNRLDGLSCLNGLVEEDIDLAPTIIKEDKED